MQPEETTTEATETKQNDPDRFEQETKDWCTVLFPTVESHTDLQMGLVDYLLHGNGDYEWQSLQAPNMNALAKHIQDVLTESKDEWSDEQTLAQIIANLVQEIQKRAYTTGIPLQPPLVIPRNDMCTPAMSTVVHRMRPSLSGSRVAAIEDKGRTPAAIRSSRLHGLSEHLFMPPKGVRKSMVMEEVQHLMQPL